VGHDAGLEYDGRAAETERPHEVDPLCAKLDSASPAMYSMSDGTRERPSRCAVTDTGSDDLASYSSCSAEKTAAAYAAAIPVPATSSDGPHAYQRLFALRVLYVQDEDMTKERAEPEDVLILRGRLSGTQRRRLARLLDTEYTPSELAGEIGFSVRQVTRVYMPDGCPHRRDADGNIWINGKEFREWALERHKKIHLSPSQAFCLTCRRPVEILDPVVREKNRLCFIESDCPHCGRRVARILKRKRRSEQ
jgi:hypothetical protein